ncbi:MAG TPA: glycosyltransferase family 2 protein [Hydrogenophaga sp.]|nr:glycosyltransferase family 2 protein [Hydrogenophaga sp.]
MSTRVTTVSAICAVVVTYNPDIEVVEQLLRQLQANACDFVVVDNQSTNADDLQAVVSTLTHCRALLRQTTNIGQAAALNLGLQKLSDGQYELALLFDQDSAIDANFCSQMLLAWDEARTHATGPVAAIGPRLEDPVSRRRIPFRSFEHLFGRHESPAVPSGQVVHTGFLITSGCLISMAALKTIGPMRADYFIDNVDLEWCFRAKSRGFQIFGTDHARLYHRIGEAGSSYLVRKGIVVQHSSLRFYYSSRNRIHLHRQPHAPRNWKLKDSVRFLLKTSYLMLTSPERRAYWTSLRQAMKDAGSLP